MFQTREKNFGHPHNKVEVKFAWQISGPLQLLLFWAIIFLDNYMILDKYWLCQSAQNGKFENYLSIFCTKG